LDVQRLGNSGVRVTTGIDDAVRRIDEMQCAIADCPGAGDRLARGRAAAIDQRTVKGPGTDYGAGAAEDDLAVAGQRRRACYHQVGNQNQLDRAGIVECRAGPLGPKLQLSDIRPGIGDGDRAGKRTRSSARRHPEGAVIDFQRRLLRHRQRGHRIELRGGDRIAARCRDQRRIAGGRHAICPVRSGIKVAVDAVRPARRGHCFVSPTSPPDKSARG